MTFNKNIKKIFSLLLLLTFTFILSGCNSNKKTITLYYPDFTDKSKNIYISRDIDVSSNDKTELLEKVKEALLEGPINKRDDYKNPYNNIVKISYVKLDNELLIVNFEGDYYALSLAEKIAIRGGIAKSYSNFTFVKNIRFMQKGIQITDEYGKKLEDLKIDNVIADNKEDDISSNIANYNLYFGTADGRMLYREERALEIQNSMLLARELVEELIKGPSVNGLSQTLPKQTKIRQLEIKDGICYVDLSKEFSTKHPGGEQLVMLTVYSIVNTLTELPEVEKVQFLIDGEKKDNYQGLYDFENPFVRNSTLIFQDNVSEAKEANPDNIVKILSPEEQKELEKENSNVTIEDLIKNKDEETDLIVTKENKLDDLIVQKENKEK